MATRKASGYRTVFILVFCWFVFSQCKAHSLISKRSVPNSFQSTQQQFPFQYGGYYPQYAQVGPLQASPTSLLVDLLNMIQIGDYPEEIVVAKINLLNYLQTSNLDIQSALVNMPDLSHLNVQDQLVGILLRLQKDLPMKCLAKADISRLILFNMMKSYLGYVPVLEGYFPQDFALFDASGAKYTNYRDVIKHLLTKLRCCEKKQGTSRQMPLPSPKTITEVKYVDRPAPPPPPQIEVRYLDKPAPPPQIITEYKYIEKPCPSPPPPEPPTTTQQTFQNLIPILPVPNNGFEKMKYEILKSFLDRKDLNLMLGSLDLTAAASDQDRLKLLLSKSATLEQIEQPVLDAIKFYLNYAKSMSSLNLYTQKEIRKQFELTQIFTDTLDFENLSIEGKLAFDAFYSFLLGVTGEQMKAFDTWTDVRTKGEFMQVLFTYFLEQSFSPDNVKQAIEFLKPLIKMDGLGATPP